MSISIRTLRADVEQRLRDLLPPTWRFENTLDDTYTALVPVVFLRFTRFDSTFNGQPIPQGTVAAALEIQLQASRTGSEAGENEIDEFIVSIIHAIDPMTDMAWSYAEKGRLDTGQLTWQLTLYALANTTPEENQIG